VRELSPGLWHWQAPHPEWRATEPWSENVSSYAVDDGERLLLFDPLSVPSDQASAVSPVEQAAAATLGDPVELSGQAADVGEPHHLMLAGR